MSTKSFLIAFLSYLLTVSASEDSHESCACASLQSNFVIDCNNTKAMTDALAILITNDCATDCSSGVCADNFKMVQSHHDFCLHEEVPQIVENSFHDYEDVCEHCDIRRKRDPALGDCPSAVCDTRGNDAFATLVSSGCLDNCDTSVCASNYYVLRSEHDNCEHDTLEESAENGIHNFEEVCESNNCNSLLSEEDVRNQLICRSDDAHVDAESSDAGAIASRVYGFFVVSFGFFLLATQ
eukprot:CAMPEP_0172499884 /NCGR_PEP_ID=MMETSP1066-20121228/132188_1 /TAXON_ID=671091 /ORGANISM="Coscinodiscus wailesii, Strain CCMP2513" /LENGTH=238 /DNA_ID=CAMNT_0013273869 /DNA_START=149 /DNA_END=865 /DNA_ORIENTATION=+